MGHGNEFAETLGIKKCDKAPYKIAEAAMAIVTHQVKPRDVLEIQVIENEVSLLLLHLFKRNMTCRKTIEH